MDFNDQKLQKRNMCEAVEDRISQLPDSIIHHILSSSSLDIKDVACTCVLSKRWKYMWTTIPTLDLRFWVPDQQSEINKFMDFVDRTLLLHRQSNILKFELSLYSNMNVSRVHSWIENLTSCDVEELTLHITSEEDIPLSIPLSLFTCESLTQLELHQCPSMHFPKNISLPKLKSLTLWRIQFGDNGCWNKKPFSNCPVLEELFLKECTWYGTKKFYISTPLLKVLEIDNDFLNAGNLGDCELKIHAPRLVSLGCGGHGAKNYDMSSFLALDNADVTFYLSNDESGRGEQRISRVIKKFLRALSHVRRLWLCVSSNTQVLSIADDYVSSLPKFHNLNHLTLLHGATTDIRIFAMLKVAPTLQCLVLSLEDYSCDDDKEYDRTEDLFRHLQSVRFMGYEGSRRESRWAKLILKYAQSLQTMTIEYHARALKSKEVVMAELLSFERASSSCSVKFVCNL